MVEHVIRTVDPRVSYREVTASRGKVQRAEPIAALYEQSRVRHVGLFAELEDQLAAMTGAGYVGDGSPDRADALVWALTELFGEVAAPPPRFGVYGRFSLNELAESGWGSAAGVPGLPDSAAYDSSPRSFWEMVAAISEPK